MSSRWSWALVGLACLLAVWAGYRLAGERYSRAQPPAYGTWLSPPRTVRDFQLIDNRGGRFARADLRGHLSLMYFGYTRCTDECPDTLAMLARLRRKVALPALRVLFVTINPRHDTPAVLTRYLRRFDPHFIGLTGTPHQIRSLAGELGVALGKIALPGGGETFEHTVVLFLFNARGREVAVFTAPFAERRLARALRSAAPRLLGAA